MGRHYYGIDRSKPRKWRLVLSDNLAFRGRGSAVIGRYRVMTSGFPRSLSGRSRAKTAIFRYGARTDRRTPNQQKRFAELSSGLSVECISLNI
jgi:hypothetical protein